MDWLSFTVGIVIGIVLGVASVKSMMFDTVTKSWKSHLEGLKPGETVFMSVTIGKDSGDDGGEEEDVLPPEPLESWRNN